MPSWRPACPPDFPAIVGMCLALYEEDAGLVAMRADQVERTLSLFEQEPSRGQAVVLDVEGSVEGYAFLVPFYSNQFDGVVCEVDELFVRPSMRGRGCGTALFDAIVGGSFGAFVGIALGVAPNNPRARRLYERVGFQVAGTGMVRVVAQR